MKRLLALFLAVAMLAAGNVLALAEEPAAGNPPIQLDWNYLAAPGETTEISWSIYSPNNSKGIRVELDPQYTITSYRNNKPDYILVKDQVRGDAKLFVISLKQPLTSEEDIGKTLEDTIEVTLSNGQTYSFPLKITYEGGASIEQVGSHWYISHLELGKEVTFSMVIKDPQNLFAVPYEIEVVQDTSDGAELPKEEQLLEIGEITKNGKEFTIQITPVKAGFEHIGVFAIDDTGWRIGKGWELEVSKDGNFASYDPFVGTEDNSPTDNAANSNETAEAIREAAQVLTSGAGELPKNAVSVSTASGATMTAIPVKLSSGSAALSVDTANTLGENGVALSANVDNGAMEVILPGGFGQINEPGRIYYPLDLNTAPSCAEEMKAAVKGNEDTRTETVKAGGDMVLPTTATITLKTKLEGRVNIYYYNEETRRFTKLATASPADGKVTFATRQMGHLVLTTGTI